MFGCEPSAVCVTGWTLCSKSHAFQHKLGTGSALLVRMGALIFAVWKQFRAVNDADWLIKTLHGWRTHTHWPLLQPGECCSSLKWLSRVAPTVWVLCKYWQGYCASEQSTFSICTFREKGGIISDSTGLSDTLSRLLLWFHSVMQTSN